MTEEVNKKLKKMKTKKLKLWEGAFKGARDDVLDFNSGENIILDQNLIEEDIIGNITHVQMLEKRKIISEEDAAAIIEALKEIHQRWLEGNFVLDPKLEDVHSNIETEVTKITSSGKKMHTARSRNDQVLLDMRLYMRKKSMDIAELILQLQEAFGQAAKADGPMVAYTHTRVAQPITKSFWAHAIAKGFERDLERIMDFFQRVNKNPLGACAIAGTSWNIDRDYTAQLLGFEGIEENEMDAINSRGELEGEFIFILTNIMIKASGIAEELIWLSQKELIKLPDEFCTGSSIMPNKKNPDVLELIRARVGRVIGNLNQILVVKKGLISGYHSDMQETKGAIMNALQTTEKSVKMLTKVIEKIEFEQQNITDELEENYAQATEIADLLARKRIPFREAHGIIGKLVFEAKKSNKWLKDIKNKRPEEIAEQEWLEAISLKRKRLARNNKNNFVNQGTKKKINDMKRRIKEVAKNLLSDHSPVYQKIGKIKKEEKTN